MAKHSSKKRPRDSDADVSAVAEAAAAAAVAADVGISQATSSSTDLPPSKKARTAANKSLFVRSLPPTATSETLTDFFSQHYPVKHAVVVVDPKTKVSRGYGFVTFTDPEDASEAKAKLNHEMLDGRRLNLDVAEARHRKDGGAGGGGAPTRVSEEKRKREEAIEEARQNPAKLIVRNLPWSVKSSEQLAKLFQPYGKIKFADLPQKKGKLSGFGFVTLRGRKNAEKALEMVNGKEVDGRTLAVDWAVDKTTWEQQNGDEAEEGADGDGAEKKNKKKTKKTKASDDADKDDEDVEMNEEERDIANFMKTMETLDSEDESEDGEDKMDEDEDDEVEDEDEEAWEEDSDASQEKKPKKVLSTDNSTTIFVRNLPYTTTDEQLKTHFEQFGSVRYARVVMDRSTDRSAGTGFVCFFKLEDSTSCIRNAPRQKPATTLSKRSVLQDETVDADGKYTLEDRVLQVSQAVSKDEATRLTAKGEAGRKGQEKDKRKLYLLSEGTIPKSSPLYNLLAPSEIKIRETSEKQRKKMIQSNPSLHLSLTRLAIRNIPRNMSSKELKALARVAVVGFATDVKEGRRQPLSKEEIARAGQLDREAEQRRRAKGKGVVNQAKIVFETKQGSKVAEETGAGASRGYGFVEYSSHRWALMGLRWMNGHALKNEAGKTQRLIVEFAIENANVVQRRRMLEEKGRAAKVEKDKEGKKEKKGEDKDGEVKGKKGKTKGKGKKGKEVDAKAKAEAEAEAETGGKKSKDAATKLAMRTKIIARKRMLRKKKAQTRA